MSNIYLNEFDHLIKHRLKPLGYLRYGDDWLCFAVSKTEIEQIRTRATTFLEEELSLTINPKIDRLHRAHKGLHYLGVDIWPDGRRLQVNVRKRIDDKLSRQNAASYQALIGHHEKPKRLKHLHWRAQ